MRPFSTHQFGDRAAIKSALATLLPKQGPSERLETFAHQCGHRSDAAMVAFSNANTSHQEHETAALRTVYAAQGHVLPLLVHVAIANMIPTTNTRPTAQPIAPSVPTVLRDGLRTLNREAFSHALALTDVLASAKAAPSGAARWFFAVAASSALLPSDPRKIPSHTEGKEQFWNRNARSLLCATLALAQWVSLEERCDAQLVESLSSRGDPQDAWESAGVDLIVQIQQLPTPSLYSVIQALHDHLPQTDPNQPSASQWMRRGIGIHPDMAW